VRDTVIGLFMRACIVEVIICCNVFFLSLSEGLAMALCLVEAECCLKTRLALPFYWALVLVFVISMCYVSIKYEYLFAFK